MENSINTPIKDPLKEKLFKIDLIKSNRKLNEIIAYKVKEDNVYQDIKEYDLSYDEFGENEKKIMSLFINFIKDMDLNIIMNNKYILNLFKEKYKKLNKLFSDWTLDNINGGRIDLIEESLNSIINTKIIYFIDKNIIETIFVAQRMKEEDRKEKEKNILQINNKRIYIDIYYLQNRVSISPYKSMEKDIYLEFLHFRDNEYENFLEDDEYKLNDEKPILSLKFGLGQEAIYDIVNKLIRDLKELYPDKFDEKIFIDFEE